MRHLSHLALVALAACGGAPRAPQVGAGGAPGARGDRHVTLTLFLDAALVQERWRVPLTDGRGTVEVPVDAGLEIEELSVLGTEGARLVGLALRRPAPAVGDPVVAGGTSGRLLSAEGNTVALVGDDAVVHVADTHGILPFSGEGREVRAVVTLEGDGREGWVELTYATPRISWNAAYALIADRDGKRAALDGAVAIDNASGVEFAAATVTVIDKSRAAARKASAASLTKDLLGIGKPDEDNDGRDLGVVDVGRGQTRLPLAFAPTGLPVREVLVFDPVGTAHDATGVIPQKDRNYGLEPKPGTAVMRSFEIQIDPTARKNLPGGPVRLFGRSDRGELAPLGAGRLFEHAQNKAKNATVPVGQSTDVKGTRQRTDFFIDEAGDVDAKGHRAGRRIIEEFTITLTNAGAHPVEVLVREHLYRGATWVLAYFSAARDRTTKEGDQLVAMRVDVPARGETRVVYRVVYSW